MERKLCKFPPNMAFLGKTLPLDPILGVNCEYKIYRLSFCNVE